MTDVVLFHHVLGLTDGVRALAETLRTSGHAVHTPDFFDGTTYDSIEEGFAAVKARGFDAVSVWADDAVAGLPRDIVYAGISLGVMSAQRLAQTRPGARGAVLLEACVPPSEFGTGWPAQVPLQVHGMDRDPFFAEEGDIDAARALTRGGADRRLFVYPGDAHLFTDSSLPTYDADATAAVITEMLTFLARV